MGLDPGIHGGTSTLPLDHERPKCRTEQPWQKRTFLKLSMLHLLLIVWARTTAEARITAFNFVVLHNRSDPHRSAPRGLAEGLARRGPENLEAWPIGPADQSLLDPSVGVMSSPKLP